ncbi:MAG TPA: universal stress protein [Chloroflexota bacterium]|nr:universal stress protein [Chloroflexota bacterium]
MARQNVLLAVSGSAFDVQLVNLACNVAQKLKGKLYVVHVLEVPRTLPLDANMSEESKQADAILTRVEDAASKLKCQPESEIIQARDVAQTLIDESEDRQVGLLILGTQRREKYGKFYLGTTIPAVLASARCRVWVIREGLDEPTLPPLPV